MANRLSQRQQAFEVLLADLSSRFANVPNDAVESQIEIALRQLIAFFGFDRSSFAEFDAHRNRENTIEIYLLKVGGTSPITTRGAAQQKIILVLEPRTQRR